jgi:hypothetical protein
VIVRFLKWALSKFEDKPVEAWPFPVEQTPKAKPALKKATTRAKKPAVAAKTARTKKAK